MTKTLAEIDVPKGARDGYARKLPETFLVPTLDKLDTIDLSEPLDVRRDIRQPAGIFAAFEIRFIGDMVCCTYNRKSFEGIADEQFSSGH